MKVNIQKLKGKIVESEKTQMVVAKALGMGRDSFARRLRGGGKDFTVEEIHGMAEVIPLTLQEVMEIFFSDERKRE